MNRRKKIKSILTKKEKKANRHNNLNKKPKYISKADRAKLEAAENTATSESSEESVSPAQEATHSDS